MHDALGRLEEVRYPEVPGRARRCDPATGRREHIDMRGPGAASPQHAMAYGHSPGGAVHERIDEVAERREVFGSPAPR